LKRIFLYGVGIDIDIKDLIMPMSFRAFGALLAEQILKRRK